VYQAKVNLNVKPLVYLMMVKGYYLNMAMHLNVGLFVNVTLLRHDEDFN
jgi:hypothetical protein